MAVIEADLTWLDRRFQSGIQIEIGEDGRIAAVGKLRKQATRRLEARALLPGFVNAHSHAFQRGLRGLGETFPQGAGSFWTWRNAMYQLVQELDDAHFRELCKQAFREMLASGITTVGEFHYFHHSRNAHDYAFDDLVLSAAESVGIRIVLLNTYYETGGINRTLETAQTRFHTPSAIGYWEHMDELATRLRGERQTLGVAAHSIRAVPIATVVALHDEATKRGLPFHMHVEEQRAEIDACDAFYGITPMGLLNRELRGQGNFVAIHCTHSRPEDIETFVDAGRGICVCPLTEANLGDGIPHAAIHTDNRRLSLGTDSNARISMFEEMRWLEYGQRLRYENRGSVTDHEGDVAGRILVAATLGGAMALGVNTGAIRSGAFADFVTVSLEAASLKFSDENSLLAALAFGCAEHVVDGVCVGGEWTDLTEGRRTPR